MERSHLHSSKGSLSGAVLLPARPLLDQHASNRAVGGDIVNELDLLAP